MANPADHGAELYRYFSITRCALMSIRSDGVTLTSTSAGKWRVYARKRPDRSMSGWLEKKRELYQGMKPWQRSVERLPSNSQLERWLMDCVCESTTGEMVEPDGIGSDGAPSWLVALGLI